MKNLGVITDNQDIATKQYVDNNSGGITFPVSIENGGTNAQTAADARENLIVAQKPKLLWSGSWSSGNLTIPEFSAFRFFIAITSSGALGDVPWLMFSTGTSYRVYGGTTSSSAAFVGGRFGSVDEDTLDVSGSSISNITAVYGLVRAADIQEAR